MDQTTKGATARRARRASEPVAATTAQVEPVSAARVDPQLPVSWRDLEYDPSQHFTQLSRRQKKLVNGREVYESVEFDYLTVAERLVWFNRDQRALRLAGYATTTSIVHVNSEPLETGDGWKATAYVRDVTGGEATMEASFTGKWSGGNVEKVGTKALGRALGALGYGTGDAPDLDEGIGQDEDGDDFSDLADSPRARAAQKPASDPQRANPTHPTAQAAQTPPAPSTQRAAPSAEAPHAPNNEGGVMLGPSQQQWDAIVKLSRLLDRETPDRAMTSEQARQLIENLNRQVREARAKSA